MSPLDRFDAAIAAHAVRLGPSRLRLLAGRIEQDAARNWVVDAVPGFTAEAAAIVDAVGDLGRPMAAAYLRGVAAALAHQEAAVRVESVWSGPTTHRVPVRATAQVLVQVVGDAHAELLLMTYSAKPYEPLRAALAEAVRRGVTVRIVVETLQGAGSAISGDEPAAAFHGLGVQLWHWPVAQRPETKGKMHAKIAVADRRTLLVSSANLTQSGTQSNIEAGLLIRGGSAPRLAAEHVDALCVAGTLERL